MGKAYRTALLATTASAMAILQSPAGAQTGATPAGQESIATAAAPVTGADVAAGDIVVTAQRRSEVLRNVPVSITALSSEDIAKAGVLSTADLARVSPGVTMTSSGNFLQPAIRGISSTGANVGESANVAVYLDGVYQPQQIATLLDLADVKQVEILKGPQGALYGQNATGGAILVTTNDPSFDAGGTVSASYGNYDAVRLRGFATAPLNDAVAVSIAAGYHDRNGFRHQVVTGERDRGLNAKVVRGKLLFRLGDASRVILTGFYSNLRDSAAQAGFPIDNNSVGYAFFPTAPRVVDDKQFGGSPDVFTRIRSAGGSVRAEFGVGVGTINSITSISHNNVRYLADIDYSPANFAEALASPLTGGYVTQELNFVSREMGRFDFLAGVFYLSGRETFVRNIFQLLTPNLVPGPRLAPSLFIDRYGRIDRESIAPYAEVSYRPLDDLTLTTSARYSRERLRGFASLVLPPPNDATVVEYPRGAQTFSKFTPRITARYAITPSSNLYASWGKGFHSGLINTANFAQAPIDPEIITAYEIGYKGRIASGINLELAAFYYDYRDLQVVAFVPPDYLEQNAASATVKGAEVNATWRITRELTLAGGLSYLDGRYKRFLNAQIFIPNGFGNDVTSGDLSHRRLARAPQLTGNASLSFEHDMRAGRITAYSSLYYSSRYGLEPTNRIRQKAYATLNTELGFAPAALPGVRFVVWGKNLTDRAHLMAWVTSQLADGGMYDEPRTFGVRAEYSF